MPKRTAAKTSSATASTATSTPVASASPASTPKSSVPVLELKEVNKSFHVGKSDIPVLKNINVRIEPGEFIIVLGPSGSGKTTLLNHFLGLEQPTTGQVRLFGHDITRLSSNEIARLRYTYFGVVFQRPDWITSINVTQNVLLPLAIHNINKRERVEKAIESLKQVDMLDHATFAPNDLSGGQQQKVALARAMINNPPAYIADEPTGNLDSVSAEKVMEMFRRLNQDQQKTIIMVTHNIEYVKYGTRTIYIRDGQVVEGIQPTFA